MVRLEDIIKRDFLIQSGVLGVYKIIERAISENRYYYPVKKYLKHAHEGIIPLATGLALDYLGAEVRGAEALRIGNILAPYGVGQIVAGLYERYVKKTPFVIIDGQTAKGENFTENDTVTIIIDGQNIGTVSTDGNGKFEVDLGTLVTSEISEDYHDVIFYDTKGKAFKDRIYFGVTPSPSSSSS